MAATAQTSDIDAGAHELQTTEPAARARALVEGGTLQELRRVAGALSGGGEGARLAAKTLHELSLLDPRRPGAVVSRIARHLDLEDEEVVAPCAQVLATVTRVAPAKVAKHSDLLVHTWAAAQPVGREGIVQALVGLCEASVVYQRRLGPHLEQVLLDADLEQLVRWSKALLPTLKGEPYANARTIVESRLSELPREEGRAACATAGVSYRGRPTG